MKSKMPYKRHPYSNRDAASNDIGSLGEGNKANAKSPEGEIASVTKRKQALRYYEGGSEAGKNNPYMPSDAGAMSDNEASSNPGEADIPPYPGGPGNDLNEVIDRSTKAPYGRQGMGWSEKSGKLGDLDPQETDQPSWVGTWSPLQEGPNGAGPVRDENYPVQRPRTFSRQLDRFQECNPEFQDVADHGDWTSYKWDENV